jgi:uracil-DNA glycosylase
MTFNYDNLINDPRIKSSWRLLLQEIKKNNPTTISNLEYHLNNEYELFEDELNIYPEIENIFHAFTFFELDEMEVCIIGQDPYHGKGQAHGLSFSVQDDIKIPPSLRNIFQELKNEYDDFQIPRNGNLTKWAQQGVLLLNASLTVLESKPNSHQELWTPLTNIIIKKISEKHKGCVFMLWGNDAKKYLKNKTIDNQKHYILDANHPSPLSANRGGWFGNNHFKLANQYLELHQKNIIDWKL